MTVETQTKEFTFAKGKYGYRITLDQFGLGIIIWDESEFSRWKKLISKPDFAQLNNQALFDLFSDFSKDQLAPMYSISSPKSMDQSLKIKISIQYQKPLAPTIEEIILDPMEVAENEKLRLKVEKQGKELVYVKKRLTEMEKLLTKTKRRVFKKLSMLHLRGMKILCIAAASNLIFLDI